MFVVHIASCVRGVFLTFSNSLIRILPFILVAAYPIRVAIPLARYCW